ncbi:hypothetical protein PSTEL_13920 [Paenibacillus stellifer]|uniref:Alpha-acetolactate decarboxylase n=1 Tax=Paenibacillus stellifer TaxID=169760 RepID=A0A089N5K0_9BACL|nr:acetolactate decarboxylase [Paenibacillus stellifer]AIQ64024.1 hypothetical protein PSTEL_13920 [Paenibacillus stellifer]
MKNGQNVEYRNTDVYTQVNTTAALVAGVMETEVTIRDLSEWGDFGLGCTKGMQESVLLLDNQTYVNKVVKDDQKIGLFLLAFFEETNPVRLQQTMDLNDLRAYIDSALPTPNIMYAVKCKGKFESIQTSIPLSFQKPYPRVVPEMTDQSINVEVDNISGTIIAFWLPSFLSGINGGAGGLHAHFISDDRKFMGHVIDCKMTEGVLWIDAKHQLNLQLPKADPAFYEVDLNGNEAMSRRVSEWIKEGIGGKEILPGATIKA